MILRVPWHFSTQELHEKAKALKIETKIKNLNQKFFKNCEDSENPLIKNLVPNN